MVEVPRWFEGVVVVALALGAWLGGGLAQAAEDDVASAETGQFKSFATPYLNYKGYLPNLVCNISNVGGTAVKIKNFEIRNIEPVGITSTSCSNPKSFKLKPGKSCFIKTNAFSVSCFAQADNVASLRGMLEFRDPGDKVGASVVMIAGASTAASADKFETIAASAMFGGPTQKAVQCMFTNVGAKAAKIKKVSFVTSAGQELPVTAKTCIDASGSVPAKGQLKPQNVCIYASAPIPVTDVQCRAEVTRKADIRASFVIIDREISSPESAILNQQPLQ